MTPDETESRLAAQRQALVLPGFDDGTAWQIGAALKALGERDRLSLAFEIRWNRLTVFSYAMFGTTPANADWIRRKRNTVELLHESSYAIGRGCLGFQPEVLSDMGLCSREYAAFGGAVPLRLLNAGVQGVVTVSGAPDHIDHNIAVEALAQVCGCQVPMLDR